MEERARREYLEQYQRDKEKGVPFFPDILFKDAVISLVIFLVLIALAYFLGAPLEEHADPADSSYTPRPEWYFLFLFQLLKYFPGSLEVIGVVVLPTLGVILLFLLPLLDQSRKRHFINRPVVMVVTSIGIISVATLSILAVREAPPPAEILPGDQTAALYTENCSGCHGSMLSVPAGINLHAVIAEGRHEGMPAWSADLTTDEIDALAGFIISPAGSHLFTEYCSACHETQELVASNPLELKQALNQGPEYPPHGEVEIPDWSQVMNSEERTALLNFLVAPDGQRLFAVDCAPCHGRAVAFAGDEADLRAIIEQGGSHLEMPPWREKLSDPDLDTLARYVVNPTAGGEELFVQYCAACHGERIPVADDFEQARQIIASGGAHETMPVWGDVLTSEQLDALVRHSLEATSGTSIETGQQLFVEYCAACHGEFGEGGPNPTRPGDVIAPISSAEYLKTRDDHTLQSITAQGQPNFGMSPFGSAFGGPLDDDQIDAIVAYLRSWEADPPVELPPEVAATPISRTGAEIYTEVCAQCHGSSGEGLIGPNLRDPSFQAKYTEPELADAINMGHDATAMIAWGEILSSEQIQQLVEFIRQWQEEAPLTEEPPSGEVQPTPEPEATTTATAPSFAADVLPLFEAKCTICHGNLGGWDGTTYDAVINTGDNAPVVIPGDPEGSLLGQKVLGTHTEGAIMPPAGKMPDEEIQIVLDWIDAGALDN